MHENKLLIVGVVLLAACAPVVAPRVEKPREYIYILPKIASPAPVVPVRTDKKGVALAYPDFADDARNAGASWCYNWSPGGTCGRDDIEFVGMVWGKIIPTVLPISVKRILGANEPDLLSQANITPEEYVAIWREIETRFADKFLVAPVPSQQNLNWLVEFRDAYIARYGNPPRFDALALHCYVSHAARCVEYAQWMIDHALAWDIVGGVWVTEFAVLPCLNPENHLREMENVVQWFEDEPSITRYAIFTNRTSMREWWMYGMPESCNPALFDFASGRYTTIGELYAVIK